MKTFKVIVAVTVPAYSNIEVKAKDEAEAMKKIEKEIEKNKWESWVWQKSPAFDPSWQEAEDLRVVDAISKVKS